MQIRKFFRAHFCKIIFENKKMHLDFGNFPALCLFKNIEVLFEEQVKSAFPEFSEFLHFCAVKFCVSTQKISGIFRNVLSQLLRIRNIFFISVFVYRKNAQSASRYFLPDPKFLGSLRSIFFASATSKMT